MAEYIISVNYIHRVSNDSDFPKENWEGYEVVTNKDTIKVLLDMNSQCCEAFDFFMLREKGSEITDDFVDEIGSNLFFNEKTQEVTDLSEPIEDITGECKTTRYPIYNCLGDESWVVLKKEYIKHKDLSWDKVIPFHASNVDDEIRYIELSNYKPDRNRIAMDHISAEIPIKMSRITFKDGRILDCPVDHINDETIQMYFKNLSMGDIKSTEESERSYRRIELTMINDICMHYSANDSASIKITTNKGIIYLTGWEHQNGYYSHDVLLQCSEFDYKVEI